MLLYSGGLRRSELINLKLTDIDSSRMLIKIRESKGKKDRYVQLSKVVLKELRKYYILYSPNDWLIEGRNNKPYSATSVENIVKKLP